MKHIRIALLGQPNSGKSTLFNGLTGAKQHVGNWPGKTVEKRRLFYARGKTVYPCRFTRQLRIVRTFGRRNNYRRIYCQCQSRLGCNYSGRISA